MDSQERENDFWRSPGAQIRLGTSPYKEQENPNIWNHTKSNEMDALTESLHPE